jgi:hypothetical protein
MLIHCKKSIFKESSFVICANTFSSCLQSTNTSWGQKGGYQALEGQVPPEGYHETAGNVKGNPKEILAFVVLC